MESVETPIAEIEGLKSVSVRAPGVSPRTALDGVPGPGRGFWARGDRWVVHAGAVATVSVRGSKDDPHRFRRVRREAAPVLDRIPPAWTAPGVSPPTPRFYGGFAFRVGDDRRDPCWRPFPAALFVLPEVEVTSRGDEARVTLRSRSDADGAGSVEALRNRAEELVRRLERSERRPEAEGPSERARLRESDPLAWKGAVEEAISWIRSGRVSKVVLARTLDLLGRAGADPADVVLSLWHDNPGTHVYLFEPAPGSALVGAAPETVATVSEGIFRATAVAGSISRGTAPEEQEALALQLLESEKDRVEHDIAVRDMVEHLRPLTEELTWDSEPHVLTLSRIQHLETRIKARLRPDEHVLSALAALHPTPAVCGLPRDAALDFLRLEEPFDRGLYAGPVGWFDAAGDGVFAPALRSGVREDGRWRLFAGAGIVSGSDPDLEWEETRIKFEPMLRALDAAGDRGEPIG